MTDWISTFAKYPEASVCVGVVFLVGLFRVCTLITHVVALVKGHDVHVEGFEFGIKGAEKK
jgi:hypothetical protein